MACIRSAISKSAVSTLQYAAGNMTALCAPFAMSFNRAAGTMGGMKGYGDKEAAEERIYFSKEDERLLRGLLNKMKKQADSSDTQAAESVLAAERSALLDIVKKYNVSEGDILKLLDWKHSAH